MQTLAEKQLTRAQHELVEIIIFSSTIQSDIPQNDDSKLLQESNFTARQPRMQDDHHGIHLIWPTPPLSERNTSLCLTENTGREIGSPAPRGICYPLLYVSPSRALTILKLHLVTMSTVATMCWTSPRNQSSVPNNLFYISLIRTVWYWEEWDPPTAGNKCVYENFNHTLLKISSTTFPRSCMLIKNTPLRKAWEIYTTSSFHDRRLIYRRSYGNTCDSNAVCVFIRESRILREAIGA